LAEVAGLVAAGEARIAADVGDLAAVHLEYPLGREGPGIVVEIPEAVVRHEDFVEAVSVDVLDVGAAPVVAAYFDRFGNFRPRKVDHVQDVAAVRASPEAGEYQMQAVLV